MFMLNENIKAIRKACGLSQEELAGKLNVVRQTVSKWEKGLSVPDAGMLIQIADALHTTVHVLLGENAPDPKEPDRIGMLAAKLEVCNEQYSRQNEHRRKIWRTVFGAVFIASTISLIRYVCFITMLYQLKNSATASSAESMSDAGSMPAVIPIWYALSMMTPVLLNILAEIAAAVGFYRTRKR